ncbi:MAG TPA: hypothetical protein VFL83_15525 [Anaeromyxobacter sp.]|nr:hypothetical protein [Anaeromyxobacter sp.]
MNRAALAALALAALPALSRAQPLPHAPGRMEPRHDRRELADDRWDLARAEQLLARYGAARARRDRWALAAVEDETLRVLDREVREARGEVRRARFEAWDDRYGSGLDRRDDRLDRRDDRRDLRRVKAIRADFWALRGRLDRRALDRKHRMLAELVQLARAELREDRVDRREEWRDARADRRW